LLLLQLAAFAIAFWGILAMGILKVSVFPVPRENSELITSGPYRFTRHPMYTGIILMAGALIAARFTWLRLIVFLILVVNQIIKLLWEERMLAVKISSYKTYMERTWRLIPWIF
jgi:protein-S-isoprenylcysteine O-methyltransferase Ste14